VYIVIIPMLRRNELKNSLQRQKSMISALSRSSQKELDLDLHTREQEGIGSKDPERAVVHCKVLANKDSIYCRE